MRKIVTWIVLALVVALGAVNVIHWKGIQDSHQKISELRIPYERMMAASSLRSILEKYRHDSSNFRKMWNPEIESTKAKLRSEENEGLNQLDQLDPTDKDRNTTKEIRGQIDELLKLSAKFEPMLFLKDAYIKPEVKEVHDAILKNLAAMEKSAKLRADNLYAKSSAGRDPSMQMLEFISALVILLVLAIVFKNYLTFVKPLDRLEKYSSELKGDVNAIDARPRLAGLYQQIATVIEDFARAVASNSKERHKFIKDVVSDLTAPLTMLKAGKSLASSDASKTSKEQQLQDAATVRLGLNLLSGSLDDLSDVVEINRLESRLDEKLIDLSEIVSDFARQLNGSGIVRDMKVTVPPMPIWVKLDGQRFERVLFHLVSKMAETTAENKRVHLIVNGSSQGNYDGLQILVQDEERTPGNKGRVFTGPEQDLLKHWTSEKGLNMMLAHKIIKAHGGSISAAGVAGTSFYFNIRLPQSRVVTGLISKPEVNNQNSNFGLTMAAPQKLATSNLVNDHK